MSQRGQDIPNLDQVWAVGATIEDLSLQANALELFFVMAIWRRRVDIADAFYCVGNGMIVVYCLWLKN